MGTIRLLSAPIRSFVRFPLVQFAVVVALILLLQDADEHSLLGGIFDGLDRLVDSTVTMVSDIFTVKSFTKSWLTFGFMIAYVYLACWLILYMARIALRAMADVAARTNLFWLRSAIARERGIGAYQAWVPLERIRPAHIPQQEWEATYAWPPNNQPPYPPLRQRLLRGVVSYVLVFLIAAALLQAFTPFPVLNWLADLAKAAVGMHSEGDRR
ncbi:hypothetical protein [Bradyrhizobium sp.]|uniref:hypothetical protein n=1 Tax=Bradyrhizobium sp. TaxID=376 RepID=UPI003C5E430E